MSHTLDNYNNIEHLNISNSCDNINVTGGYTELNRVIPCITFVSTSLKGTKHESNTVTQISDIDDIKALINLLTKAIA